MTELMNPLMTDTPNEPAAEPVGEPVGEPAAKVAAPAAAQRPRGRRNGPRPPQQQQQQRRAPDAPRPADATLEKLAALYPRLFGADFLPLKRGVFEELMAAHPDALEREALKEALSQHTRSTRYLTAVAAGRPRHDLQGEVNEEMAPDHVHQALLEVFRRRARRGTEDLRPQLQARIVRAFEASGMSRADYTERMRGRDEEANEILDQAMAEAAMRAAKAEALLRAFEGSGQTVEGFAGMYGLNAREAAEALERARRQRS